MLEFDLLCLEFDIRWVRNYLEDAMECDYKKTHREYISKALNHLNSMEITYLKKMTAQSANSEQSNYEH